MDRYTKPNHRMITKFGCIVGLLCLLTSYTGKAQDLGPLITNDPTVVCQLGNYWPDRDKDGKGDANATAVNIISCDQFISVNPPIIKKPIFDSNGNFEYNELRVASNNDDCHDDNQWLYNESTWYPDTDGDDYGDDSKPSIISCARPDGYAYKIDCDDNNPTITGQIRYYIDNDRDGFGVGNGELSCEIPSLLHVTKGGDFDDTNPFIINLLTGTYCSDQPQLKVYIDDDGDGYGTGIAYSTCSVPDTGYAIKNGDCNDDDPEINIVKWYRDKDGDGFGDPNEILYKDNTVGNILTINSSGNIASTDSCTPTPPDGYVYNNSDHCPDEKGPNNGCIIDEDPDENLNSIRQLNFDSNGDLIAASKSYFDALGKPTQSQSYDIKKQKVWASETRYDSQGRPALSTLSAPIGTDPRFSYKEGFIKKGDNTDFTTSDFENNTPENPTEVGDQQNTLGWYYSDSNTNESNGNSYQDITKRPYSRTIFSELNPGAALKTIGGNQIDDEWKQGYTFSMPAGQELTQSGAFGDPKYHSDSYKIVKTVSRDVHGVEAVLFTDTDGKTLAAARSGNEDNNTASRISTIDIGAQGFVDIHIPVGETSITITGASNAIEIYDLITEQITTTPLDELPNGFYRIAITGLDAYEANTISVTYPENYYDYSLNYYDKAGRLISSEQPLYTHTTDDEEPKKLKSTFEYNALGQLTQTHSPDEGDAWFLYRKDGQIRFSINSKQWENTQFSYTNYDRLGRPIESGVHKEVFVDPQSGIEIDNTGEYLNSFPDKNVVITNSTDPFKTTLTSILDAPEEDNGGFPDTANRAEVHKTTYDYLQPLDKNYLTNVHTDYANPSFLSGNVAKTWNNQTTTYYSYDIYGRVQWIVQNIADLGNKTIDYEYDPITSQVTRVLYQKGQPDQFIHKYTYDDKDYSLIKVETSTDDVTYTENAQYEYYETGALKTLNLADKLQEIDYVYNLNGALKSINQLKLDDNNKDLFGMNIHYYKNDYTRTNTPKSVPTLDTGIDQYNGNIKAIEWNTRREDNQTTPGSYYYDYNKNNWLTGASFDTPISDGDPNVTPDATRNTPQTTTEDIEVSQVVTLGNGFSITANNNLSFSAKIVGGAVGVATSGDYNVSNITYDANGNIQSLDRNKDAYQGSNAMDKLAYTYKDGKPNQLLRVDDAVSSDTDAYDIKDQINEENYVYNAIGQLIENKEEKITYIYNASGLVTEVAYDGTPVVKFFYNDKNHRVKKEAYNITTGSLDYTAHYVRDAAGTAMAIYTDRVASDIETQIEYTIYGSSRLGVYNKGTGSSLYQLTDHLGNVRAVVGRTDTGQQMAMTTATDYYPFGMPMPNRNDNGDYRYDYQGNFSEKDDEIGLNSFERRLYDTRIGKWLSPDDIKRSNQSPYMGMGNNPILYGDPDGRDIIILNSSMAVSGLGHAATLIGNDTDGWRYVSKNGTDHKWYYGGGLAGPNKSPDLGNKPYNSNTGNGDDFRGTGLNAKQVMQIVNKKYMDAHSDGESYDNYVRVETTKAQDELAYKAAYNEANSFYSVCGTSCVDVPQNALKASGIDFKSSSFSFGFNNIFPNRWFIDFASNNNNNRYNKVPSQPNVTIITGDMTQEGITN